MKDVHEAAAAQVRGHAGLPPVDVERVLLWSRYSGRAVAQIQARGMSIDVPLVEPGAGEQGAP